MRNIRTSENFVEFLELNNDGQIINSKGFQFGELYFEIKNKKVTFFLNDPSKPFGSMVWSIDIPFELDGVVYEDEDTASSALHNIMNDRFQEQLDQLKEDLAAEEARAQEAEAQLDDKIDDESARAIAAENRLQDQVTELSGTVATFDERITRNTNDISALTDTVNDEISRSVAKDAEHDASISGLTNSLDNEIARALAAESGITANLNAEIQNRIADVDAEETRALAAESGITANLNSEISRSTEKDAQHDTQISALTVSLDNEINRATTAENSLRSDLNDEIADRISGDTNLQNQLNAEIARAQNAEEDLDDKIDLEIANRIADVNAEENRAIAAEQALDDKIDNEITRSTAKDASHDAEISGLSTSLQNEINRAVGTENSLRNDLNAEIQNRIDAISGLSNSINTEISRATSVENALRSDLTNETSARTTADTALQTSKADKVSAVASAIYNSTNKTIDFKNISGTVISSIDARDFIKDGMVDTVTISNNNLVITFNTDAGKEDIVISLASIFDPNNYYTKSEVDASQLVQDNKINAISGDVQTLSGKVDTISGDVITLGGNIQTLSGEVQTISGDVQTISGKVDDMKTYVGGRGITIATGETADTISFNLPISAGTGSNSIIEGYKTKTGALSSYSHAEGYGSTTVGNYSHAEGYSSTTVGDYSHAEGILAKATGDFSHAEGLQTEAKSVSSHAEGKYTSAATPYSFVCGLNGLTSGNPTVVEDTNTIFAIGNGLDDTHKTTKIHNALEVKLNGDIYIADTNASGEYYQKPMIKLQDALGQGGGVTSGQVQTMIDNSLVGYQEELTAGTGIDITNNVISVTGGSQPVDAYTKAESDAKFATITNFNSHSGNTTMHVTSTEKATWNAKADASNVYNKTEVDNKLSAKPNVWCGDETAWSQISGSTESGTIYLVY